MTYLAVALTPECCTGRCNEGDKTDHFKAIESRSQTLDVSVASLGTETEAEGNDCQALTKRESLTQV